MNPLPPTFAATRESLRAVACYVISPARKARTGRIGLRATGDGFGTPPFDDGSRIVVRGAVLAVEPTDAEGRPITTLVAGAAYLGLDLSADPGVGHDLPPFRPEADLAVDPDASFALGAWYAYGQASLDALRDELSGPEISEAQLWPEHFDLAVTVDLGPDTKANVGFSPGDASHDDPYLYVGPFDTSGLTGDYWNAPFGALVGYEDLRAAPDARAAALAFVQRGLGLLTPG